MLPFETNERARYGVSWTGLRLRLLRAGQERSFKNATGVIFISQYAHDMIVSLGAGPAHQAKRTVIPHGFNQDFSIKPRPQHPISNYSSEHPFRILYVSIIDVYKHQWHVADAMKILRDQGFHVVLDLVGPAHGPSLSRLVRKNKEIDPTGDLIRYHGPVPYADLPDWYRDTNLFVFASSCENLPNILVEAMASGLPIACSDRGPMPEVLGSGGHYFDPESPEEIAAVIGRMLRDPGIRQRAAIEARGRADDHDWVKCSQLTADFLVKMAEHTVSDA